VRCVAARHDPGIARTGFSIGKRGAFYYSVAFVQSDFVAASDSVNTSCYCCSQCNRKLQKVYTFDPVDVSLAFQEEDASGRFLSLTCC